MGMFDYPKGFNPRLTSLGIRPVKIQPIKIKQPKIKGIGIGRSVGEGGKEFESRVKKDLKKKGYEVHSSDNRHYDLYAKKGGKDYYIECKCTTARLSPQEFEFFNKLKKQGKIYMIARKTKTNRIEYKKY